MALSRWQESGGRRRDTARADSKMIPDDSSDQSSGKQTGTGGTIRDVSGEDADRPVETLASLVPDPGLSEDLALAMLKRPDLSTEILETLGKNSPVLQHRKVRLALVSHPKTPRHVSLPLLRHLYTFELMQLALTPTAPADVKKVADEALINRLETISTGEKLSLARRASGSVAGALLFDKDTRVMRAALENPRLTESSVVKSLTKQGTLAPLVEAVCHHPKWSLRQEVRITLLRSDKTPLAKALEFSQSLPDTLLREILQNSRLPAETQAYLLEETARAKAGE
jgi:hypothetical protein